MFLRLWLFLAITGLLKSKAYAQKQTYAIKTVAFYNVENLFDTINDPFTFDDARTPKGKDAWTQERYQDKIQKIARVIAAVGKKNRKAAPDIIGLAEIENEQVLVDLIHHPILTPYNYSIIHKDAPDKRGIDVAFLYQSSSFTPDSYTWHVLDLAVYDKKRRHTREQLVVSGDLDGDSFFFLINHWPSRSGGQAKSEPKRFAAAALQRKLIDSIQAKHADAKIISMGDFNDGPTAPSIKHVLQVYKIPDKKNIKQLFNPMESLAKQGVGSLAYRDRWYLFDQFFITSNTAYTLKGYRFWKAFIYNPTYLQTPKGRYKGYPYRSYAAGQYIGGYSDHYPVYLHLVKPIGLVE